jgi:hypothetical protein
VLTEIKRDFGKFQAYDVEPLTSPDILAERPVIIFGKYKGDAKGTITIKGYTGIKKYTESIDVSAFKPDSSNVALRYLWAREKIKYLDDYNDYGVDSTKIKEVTKLGLKYNLLTAYTSFIAVDKTVVVDKTGKLITVEQPLPLPENVSNYAVGADYGLDDETADFNAEEFSIFKSVDITTVLDNTKEQLVISDIENKISESIKAYLLAFDNIDLDSINVSVSSNGKVKSIIVSGNKPADDVNTAIKNLIAGWDFSAMGINKEWQFIIKF